MRSIFEQTADWQLERLGKFTASEIHKLMQKGRAKDQYFGETAHTYIKGRLAEILTQEPCVQLDGLAAIEWGNSNEIDAVLTFEKHTGLTVDYFGKGNPKFFPYEKQPDWAGGSPDGLIGESGVIEVKCPYNSTHHITHLLISTPQDLKKEKPDYYGQIQFNMLCTGRENGYFVSYDPRPLNHKIRTHILEIPFDKEYCDELEERIEEAVKLLKVFLDCVNPSKVTA
jgi:hypothetical protein